MKKRATKQDKDEVAANSMQQPARRCQSGDGDDPPPLPPARSMPSSSDSAILESAAATPPSLRSTARLVSTPGAFSIPGISGSNDEEDDTHDNLLDADDNDAFQQQTTTDHSTLTMSTPIVAELAPNERDVEDRLAERLEVQISQQINRRLQEEVDRRWSRELCRAEEVIQAPFPRKKNNENFTLCGIRRTCWGLILCILFVLVVGGAGGTYLWFSRASADETESTTSAPSFVPSLAPTLVPTSRAPTAAPTDSSASPTMVPSVAPVIDPRNYLLTTIGPYIVPESFQGSPETYILEHESRNLALEWMAANYNDAMATTPIPILVERYVLAVLYFSTGGNNETWDESLSFLAPTSVCEWNTRTANANSHQTIRIFENLDGTAPPKGVFCENGLSFVTSIEISDNGLSGTVPWELSLIEYLGRIDFDTNELYGSVPVELGSLRGLQALWLKDNHLTGTLPKELAKATQLASIDFEGNRLSSTLPSEWASLSNLFYLGLGLNRFDGTLPSQWAALSSMRVLDVGNNRIEGSLPPGYGKLTNMESLYLESNRFEGPLPPTYGNLTSLVDFYVDDNALSGSVPDQYASLSALNFFWFQRNLLTGVVDELFCLQEDPFGTPHLIADCLVNETTMIAAVGCSCCRTCCDSHGENCTEQSLEPTTPTNEPTPTDPSVRR